MCKQTIAFTGGGAPARERSVYGSKDTVFLLPGGEVKLGKFSRDQLTEPGRTPKDEKGILGRGNSKGLGEGMHLSCPGWDGQPQEARSGTECFLEGGWSSLEERPRGSWTDTWKGQDEKYTLEPAGTGEPVKIVEQEKMVASELWLRGLIQQQKHFKVFAEGKAFLPRDAVITGHLKSWRSLLTRNFPAGL